MSLLRIDFSGIEKLLQTFDVKLWTIPLQKRKQMIEVCAENVLKRVKQNAIKMTKGQYSLGSSVGGTIANSAYIDKKGMSGDNPYSEINFKGTVAKYYEPRDTHPYKKNGKWYVSRAKGTIPNGRRRMAEVAFLNEYGVPKNRNQGARGYLSKAMDEGMNDSIDELLGILEEYIADAIVRAI